MKKRKPGIIKDPKARGEWAEMRFMERAAERGLCVSKPWGDSSSYDFVIGRPGHFVSVQVKSTVCQSGGGYECCIRGRKNEAYEPGSFDFLAAYVVLRDAWYIIPAGAVLGKETVALFSQSKHAKYEGYREAWHLLREASAACEDTATSERSADAEPVTNPGSGAVARMENAMNYFKRYLAQGNVLRQKENEDV